VAATVMEEDLVLEADLDMENPTFGLGGHVGHCSRIWPRLCQYLHSTVGQLEKA